MLPVEFLKDLDDKDSFVLLDLFTQNEDPWNFLVAGDYATDFQEYILSSATKEDPHILVFDATLNPKSPYEALCKHSEGCAGYVKYCDRFTSDSFDSYKALL